MHPDFTQIRHPVQAGLLAVPLAAGFALLVFLSAAAWKRILQFISGAPLPYRPIAGVYVRANIAKYIPGNVMHFAGRNLLAGRLGFSQLDIAFASAIEVLLLIFTACGWSAALAFPEFAAVAAGSAHAIGSHLPAAVGIAAALAAAAAGLLLWIRRKRLWRKYRRFFTPAFLQTALRLIGVYSLTLLLPGGALAVLFPLLFGGRLSAHALLLTVAAYTLSWVAGYIVPGAPGGIGVRESALLLVLSPLYPKGSILIAMIFHRVLSILGDALAFGLAAARDARRPAGSGKRPAGPGTEWQR